MRKRARTEIIYDMLYFIQNSKGHARSTNILYRTNLSVSLLKKYLNGLLGDGMITTVTRKGKIFYIVTEKGIEFINLMRRIDSMTDMIELDKEKRTK